ncbi:unnamed protein product [Lasius platythorax]|uniref:Uncharacterized protein n=1 Tax=Lasius platythorax TaxID=488582 RepID=A0AAV2NF88_9HYME
MPMERVDDNTMRQLANGTHQSIEQPEEGFPISVNSQCTANTCRNSRNAVVVVREPESLRLQYSIEIF